MTPLISPWFIYLLCIVGGLKAILITGAIVLGMMAIGALIGTVCMKVEADGKYGDDNDRKWENFWRGVRKKTLPWCLIFTFLAVFVPSRNYIIAMFVTKFITTESIAQAIETGGQFTESVKKDIIDIIDAMKGDTAETTKLEKVKEVINED